VSTRRGVRSRRRGEVAACAVLAGVLLMVGLLSLAALQQTSCPELRSWTGPVIAWDEASRYDGQQVVIEGPVAGTGTSESLEMVFINLGSDYPDPERVSVGIPIYCAGAFESRYGERPEDYFRGRTIRVYGEVFLIDGGTPAIHGICDPACIQVREFALAPLVAVPAESLTSGSTVAAEDLIGLWRSEQTEYEFILDEGQLICSKVGTSETYTCEISGSTLQGTYVIDRIPHMERAEIVVDESGAPVEIRWEFGAVFVWVDTVQEIPEPLTGPDVPSSDCTDLAIWAGEVVPWHNAGEYPGQTVAVEGLVVRAVQDSDGTTYLNVGNKYPNPDRFEIAIPRDCRTAFVREFGASPEDYLYEKTIRVFGAIELASDGAPTLQGFCDPDCLAVIETGYPEGLSDSEIRDACRALKGQHLRSDEHSYEFREVAGELVLFNLTHDEQYAVEITDGQLVFRWEGGSAEAQIVLDDSGNPSQIVFAGGPTLEPTGVVAIDVPESGLQGKDAGDAFVGVWQGTDSDDGSSVALEVSPSGDDLHASLADGFSFATGGLRIEPGYEGDGFGFVTSSTQAQITFALTRPGDGAQATAGLSLALSADRQQLTLDITSWDGTQLNPPEEWGVLHRSSEQGPASVAVDQQVLLDLLGVTAGISTPEQLVSQMSSSDSVQALSISSGIEREELIALAQELELKTAIGSSQITDEEIDFLREIEFPSLRDLAAADEHEDQLYAYVAEQANLRGIAPPTLTRVEGWVHAASQAGYTLPPAEALLGFDEMGEAEVGPVVELPDALTAHVGALTLEEVKYFETASPSLVNIDLAPPAGMVVSLAGEDVVILHDFKADLPGLYCAVLEFVGNYEFSWQVEKPIYTSVDYGFPLYDRTSLSLLNVSSAASYSVEHYQPIVIGTDEVCGKGGFIYFYVRTTDLGAGATLRLRLTRHPREVPLPPLYLPDPVPFRGSLVVERMKPIQLSSHNLVKDVSGSWKNTYQPMIHADWGAQSYPLEIVELPPYVKPAADPDNVPAFLSFVSADAWGVRGPSVPTGWRDLSTIAELWGTDGDQLAAFYEDVLGLSLDVFPSVSLPVLCNDSPVNGWSSIDAAPTGVGSPALNPKESSFTWDPPTTRWYQVKEPASGIYRLLLGTAVEVDVPSAKKLLAEGWVRGFRGFAGGYADVEDVHVFTQGGHPEMVYVAELSQVMVSGQSEWSENNHDTGRGEFEMGFSGTLLQKGYQPSTCNDETNLRFYWPLYDYEYCIKPYYVSRCPWDLPFWSRHANLYKTQRTWPRVPVLWFTETQAAQYDTLVLTNPIAEDDSPTKWQKYKDGILAILKFLWATAKLMLNPYSVGEWISFAQDYYAIVTDDYHVGTFDDFMGCPSITLSRESDYGLLLDREYVFTSSAAASDKELTTKLVAVSQDGKLRGVVSAIDPIPPKGWYASDSRDGQWVKSDFRMRKVVGYDGESKLRLISFTLPLYLHGKLHLLYTQCTGTVGGYKTDANGVVKVNDRQTSVTSFNDVKAATGRVELVPLSQGENDPLLMYDHLPLGPGFDYYQISISGESGQGDIGTISTTLYYEDVLKYADVGPQFIEGGRTWITVHSQPTPGLYEVELRLHDPMRFYDAILHGYVQIYQ
jgi:hypothetical protein